MIYVDKISNFEELLNKDNSVFIQHNNIHAIAIEIYKVANNMSMKKVFKLRNAPHYNLQHTSHFSTDPTIVSIPEIIQPLFRAGPNTY